MEIILKEDVIGLGYKNDIVNVKSGYGRNYLIPQGKGVIASESAKKVLAENLRQQAVKLAKIKEAAQAVADKLAGVALTIATKVSSSGSIYGSVNSLQIADELQKLGFDIDRKKIVVKDVKTVGDYVAVVKLHKEVDAEVPFTVVAEGAPVVEETPAPVVEETPAPVVEETPAPVVEEAPAPVEEEAPAAVEEAPAEEVAPEAEEETPAAE